MHFDGSWKTCGRLTGREESLIDFPAIKCIIFSVSFLCACIFLREAHRMLTYSMRIAGLERELPICKVTDDLYIGAFICFGDAELTVACAGSF